MTVSGFWKKIYSNLNAFVLWWTCVESVVVGEVDAYQAYDS